MSVVEYVFGFLKKYLEALTLNLTILTDCSDHNLHVVGGFYLPWRMTSQGWFQRARMWGSFQQQPVEWGRAMKPPFCHWHGENWGNAGCRHFGGARWTHQQEEFSNANDWGFNITEWQKDLGNTKSRDQNSNYSCFTSPSKVRLRGNWFPQFHFELQVSGIGNV